MNEEGQDDQAYLNLLEQQFVEEKLVNENFIESLPTLLPNYIGGQIEVQGKVDWSHHGFQPKHIFRGEIKDIKIEGYNVIIETAWLAEMNEGWKIIENKPYVMDMQQIYFGENIGSGSYGGDRLCFHSDIVGELVVLFPPDGSKLSKPE
jgi:hypothetical protein